METLSPNVTDKPKKRKRNGDKKSAAKQRRLSSHEIGENCNCKRFNCFNNVSEIERTHIITHFNALSSKNEQDSFLNSCISLEPITRRRLRKGPEDAKPRDTAVKYFVNVVRDGKRERIQVCATSFTSFFGVSRKRVELIRSSVMKTGI